MIHKAELLFEGVFYPLLSYKFKFEQEDGGDGMPNSKTRFKNLYVVFNAPKSNVFWEWAIIKKKAFRQIELHLSNANNSERTLVIKLYDTNCLYYSAEFKSTNNVPLIETLGVSCGGMKYYDSDYEFTEWFRETYPDVNIPLTVRETEEELEKEEEPEKENVIHIYHTGHISEVDFKKQDIVEYIYHDDKDCEHHLGQYTLIWVDELVRGDKGNSIPSGYLTKGIIENDREKYTYSDKIIVKGTKGSEKNKIRSYKKTGEQTALIKINGKNHNNDGVSIKYKLMPNSTRPYIHPNAYGAVLGAIAQVGFSDITIVGFTSKDNHGFPSKTHVNGKNGDLRYLNKDKLGNVLYINETPNKLDIERQEKFIDALINFGWRDFYSYRIEFALKQEKFLLKKSVHLSGHNNHMHSRGFREDFK